MNSPRPVERVLDALDVAKGPDNNGEYVAFCIAHDDRNTPNLHVREDENRNVLVWCSAGCSQERVLAALEERGVGKSDLFANLCGTGGGGLPTPHNLENRENDENPHIHQENSENGSACTVAAYAEYVQLPED